MNIYSRRIFERMEAILIKESRKWKRGGGRVFQSFRKLSRPTLAGSATISEDDALPVRAHTWSRKTAPLADGEGGSTEKPA